MKLLTSIYTTFIFCCLLSCVDQEFDQPPANGEDPTLEATGTVLDLLSLYETNETNLVTEDIIIKVLVTADDQAGNLFRSVVVEDETGGIALRMAGTDIYTRYPVGRRLFIKCKGLSVGDFAGLPQLGGRAFINDDGEEELEGIQILQEEDFIIPGSYGNPVEPMLIDINQLNFTLFNRLVKLENVKISATGGVTTYADGNNQRSINHTIQSCNGGSILMRTSGFADFAGDDLPTNSGSIVGVYSVFNTNGFLEASDRQILIRNTNDVQFDSESCTSNISQISISELRSQYSGSETNVNAGLIKGVVISDSNSGNLVDQNLFIQDQDAGIVLRFTSGHSFDLGDELEVNVSGQELSEFNGLLQVHNLPLENATKLSTGNQIVPRSTTLVEVIRNSESWESTLVKIVGVELSGASTFAGSVTVSSANASIDMFTRNSASFADDAIPSGLVDLTAIVSEFNVAQLLVRNRDDVSGGSTDGGGGDGGDGQPVIMVDEDFSTVGVDEDVNLTDWTNTAVKGTRLWRGKEFSGNRYIQATSFNDTNPEMEAWLITPEIDMSVVSSFSFETAKAFYDHDGLSVFVSTDFDGDIASATWDLINARIAGSSDADNEWIKSGDIDLSGYSENVFIGFKYEGDNANNDTSYRIDNILVE